MSTSNARWRALALLSAIFGAGVSVYLLIEYTTGQAGICLTGSGCDAVRASDYAYPLGIPMPLFGVAFYLVAAWLAHRTLRGAPILGLSPGLLLLVAALLGAAFSAILTGIEAFVIESFCTWCLASAVASLGLLVGAVGLLLSPRPEVPSGGSGRVRQQRARAEAAQRSSLRSVTLWGSVATAGLVSLLLVAGAMASGPGPQQTGDELAPPGSPRLGNGAVTVVEFADFQCPACAVVGPTLTQMAAASEMTLVFRHFPLETIHANANAASRAVEAAEAQDAFFEMGDALYAAQASWAELPAAEAEAYFASVAEQLGLDVAQWSADYASQAVRDAVAADAAAARQLGLSGTPTLYIGGELYEGDMSADGLSAAIAAASGTGS